MILGITGRIGVGKTTGAAIISTHFGCPLTELDVVGHSVLMDPGIIHQLTEIFGSEIMSDRGEIDRSKLGKIVFDNKIALTKLNDIVHPKIYHRVVQILQKRPQIVVGALLTEIGLRPVCDRLIVITARPELVEAKIGERARVIGQYQRSVDDYCRDADCVIENTFDESFGDRLIAAVHALKLI